MNKRKLARLALRITILPYQLLRDYAEGGTDEGYFSWLKEEVW